MNRNKGTSTGNVIFIGNWKNFKNSKGKVIPFREKENIKEEEKEEKNKREEDKKLRKEISSLMKRIKEAREDLTCLFKKNPIRFSKEYLKIILLKIIKYYSY